MAVIAGNWKMHMGPSDTRAFFEQLQLGGVSASHELMIFPPAASLPAAIAAASGDGRVQIGVQNIHWEEKGAFTGETSAAIAADVGATVALIGHSERRHVFGETDEETALKVAAARRHGLTPVLCVGETLTERRDGRVDEVILRQLNVALPGLSEGAGPFMIAYEPVWAIGTGETATPDDAATAHGTLRVRLEEALGASVSTGIPLLYGGSVKPANAAELLAAQDVDGVLVGGASLDPASFVGIASATG